MLILVIAVRAQLSLKYFPSYNIKATVCASVNLLASAYQRNRRRRSAPVAACAGAMTGLCFNHREFINNADLNSKRPVLYSKDRLILCQDMLFVIGSSTLYRLQTVIPQLLYLAFYTRFFPSRLVQSRQKSGVRLDVALSKRPIKQFKTISVQGMPQEFGCAGVGASWRALGLKTAGAKGDVPKICKFVHPLHPL